MSVKTEKELREEQRSHWLKAMAAVELRNFDYAISLLQGILRDEPEFLIGRQLLRRAEAIKSRGERRSLFNTSTASLAVMKAQRELKKNPKRAIEMAEKVLELEPYHRQANLLLKEAALAAGCPEIGVFALQTLLEENPRDTRTLHELGRLYHQLGDNEQAVEIYHRLTEIDPRDAEAQRLGKDASARASMKRGGWAEAESYRDLIKDKEAAISLEQQNRMQLTGASLKEQIAQTYTRHQAEPQNIDLARRLGALNEQKEDFANAIAWYQYAANLTNPIEAGLAQKIADLSVKQLEAEIAEHEEFLAAHGPEYESSIVRLKALQTAQLKRSEMLIDSARQRLGHNPTDLRFRFELGENLVKAGRYREALPELQRARQNPNARLKAMNLLGRCYRELGMFDLAIRQLEEAAKEIPTMGALKKEIVYDLGLTYEQTGDRERSISALKQIYEVDYGYKDVATRVENSYLKGIQ